MLAWVGLAAGATLTVDPGDPAAFGTVSMALAEAESGDTLEVHAGVYADCLDTGGLDLTLTGLGGSTVTSLQGLDEDCQAVLAVSGGTVAVSGFTITNGHGRGLTITGGTVEGSDLVVGSSGRTDWGGGGAYVGYASFTCSACTFLDNTGAHGAGLYVDQGATLVLSDTAIASNVAETSGGGLYAYAYNDLTLTDVTFRGNRALDGSGGGAVVSWYTPLSLTRVDFDANEASSTGGGLYLYATDADIPMTEVSFTANVAGSTGGGIEAVWWNRMTVSDSRFEGNQSGGYGGGMTNWYDGSLTVTGTVFQDNVAASSGGAIGHYPNASRDLHVSDSTFSGNVSGGAGGAIWAVYGADMTVLDSTFHHNTSGEASVGGAMEIYVADSATVRGNHWCGNTGGYGGGLGIQWTGVDAVTNNVFQDNTALRGGGLYRYADYDGTLTQNTFVGNEATDWGGGYYTSWSYGAVANSVFVHTRGGNGVYAQEAGTAEASLLWHDGWWDNTVIDAGGYFWTEDGRDGNVVGDPGFIAWSDDGDCTNDDLRFGWGSPFKDAGDPETLDRDGSVADLGAWGGPEAPLEDRDGDGADTASDCDDTDPAIHPGAEDLPEDGIDQDCDGADAETPPEDTGDTGDTGVDTPDTGDSGTPADSEEPADSDPGPVDTGEVGGGGCGCAAGDGGAGWLWLLAVVLPWRRRRA